MTIRDIFFNPYGRLRSGWRAAIFTVAFVVVSTLIGSFTFLASTQLSQDEVSQTYFYFIAVNPFVFLAALLIGWLCVRFLENLPFKSLGVSFSQNWFKDLILGLIVGILTILFAVFVGTIFGGFRFQINQTASGMMILQSLGVSLLIFIIGAAVEEILFRGYVLQTFSRAKLAWFAILLTSLFFAAGHLNNPNVNYYSTINTALAGIWLGAAYLKTRNLWFPFAIHFVWNWIQGQFLGIPVSGLRMITPAPILQAVNEGPVWLTGGNYGIEGGLACTIVLIVSTLLIWFLPIFKPTEEMLALTNEENPKPQRRGGTEKF